jgi:HK97 family phage prohead protease
MPLPIPEDLVNTDRTRDCLISQNGAIELRAVTPLNDQPGFDGYILTWNTVDDRGTFFTKGSAKKSIKERGMDAPHLWMHQAGSLFGGDVPLPIGRHTSIEEDDIGVRVSVALNEDQTKGAEVLSALRFGNKLGLSFGFDRLGDRSANDKDKLDLSVAPDWVKKVPTNELRAITEFRFWESSSVIFGSNAKAKPTKIRSLLEITDPAEWEQFLNDLRAGTLDHEMQARIDQIVAAEQVRAAGTGQNHPTDALEARRNLDVEFTFLWGDDPL